MSEFEGNVNRLTEELGSGDFRFEPYGTFPIRDPKTRLIHAPTFRDRVAHHAMIAVLGPVFETGAIDHSYACRAGKGHHAAVEQARLWVRRTHVFFKADVSKYYDSVNHDQLRQALARRFREKRVLALLDRLLESYSHHPGHGLPIGALTSQYLGNFFLEPIDHWAHSQAGVSHYARYMDDMLFLGEHTDLVKTRRALVGRLGLCGLEIRHGGVLNHAAAGIPWLGFTVYPDRLRLNRPGRRRLRRRFHRAERTELSGLSLQARVTALFAHARVADDRAWRREVCRFSRFGDTQEPESRRARRLVEQHCQELPLRLPQQEEPSQPQQESGLSCPAFSPRHNGQDRPPDVACSRAPANEMLAGDKSLGKPPLSADSCPRTGSTKVDSGAPLTPTPEDAKS